MNNFTKQLALLAIFLVTTHIALAQITLTLRPDGNTGKDAAVDANNPNNNYGYVDEFAAFAWTSSSTPFVIRQFVDYDLSSIPANAIIQSATLYLYCNITSVNTMLHNSYPGSPYPLTNESLIQRITAPWNENTVTWNNQPSVTSFNAALIPASTSKTQNFQIDMKQLIQDYVSNPTASFGFAFRLQDETAYRSLVFASSDHTDALIRPKLEVAYTFPLATASVNAAMAPVLYPNPANDILQIDNIGQNATLEIFTIYGSKMYAVKTQDAYQKVDVSSWNAGFYILRASYENGTTAAMQFVKQ